MLIENQIAITLGNIKTNFKNDCQELITILQLDGNVFDVKYSSKDGCYIQNSFTDIILQRIENVGKDIESFRNDPRLDFDNDHMLLSIYNKAMQQHMLLCSTRDYMLEMADKYLNSLRNIDPGMVVIKV